MVAGEEGSEQGTEGRACGRRDADSCLGHRPQGDVGGGVEEVATVGEVLDIGDSDDCGG